jgi:ParB-like nuclease domain
MLQDTYAPPQDVPLTTLFNTYLATDWYFLDNPEDWLQFLDECINDTDVDMAALAESMQTQGQQNPIEIYRGGTIWKLTNGCHRLTLAVLLGWDSVRVTFLDLRSS